MVLYQQISLFACIFFTLSCDLGQPVPLPNYLQPDNRPRDRGAGLLIFDQHGLFSGNFQTDSMEILLLPSDTSQRIATFIQEDQGNQGYRYYVPELLSTGYTNAIEYGYEILGLPFDSINATRQWFRAVYGFQEPGKSLKGWVRLTKPNIDTLTWATELQRHPLFFWPRTGPTKFYNSPHGDSVSFPLQQTYIMYPVSRDSLWLRVRIVTPSNYCDDPPNPTIDTLWIRYIEPDGRPLVFYYTRGC